MSHKVCPRWLGYGLINPLRRLIHKPERILAGLVAEGAVALDVGPAMGYFTLPMARMVGPTGTVVCVDVQQGMLDSLKKRAARAGLADRLVLRCCTPASLCLADFDARVDFALAFAVVHEIADTPNLFAEISRALKPGALCLVAEPRGHVNAPGFDQTLAAAEACGLAVASRPKIAWFRAALLRRD